MLIRILSCALLLQSLLGAAALAQSPISLDKGAAPGFDYDAALAFSQDAIGRGRGYRVYPC